MFKTFFAASVVGVIVLLAFPSKSDARPRGYHNHHHAKPVKKVRRHKVVKVRNYNRHSRRAARVRQYAPVTIVGGRPAGCPHRYCGCGTARYLGLANRGGRLNLAANWLAFPRAHPAPGMAAARRGHVFAIIKVLGPGRVLAYDSNSGGGRTRIHVRSLAGYSVVNPRGSSNRYAATHNGFVPTD